MTLCVALNYGGRAEIVDAVNAILAEERTSLAASLSRRVMEEDWRGICTATECRIRTC